MTETKVWYTATEAIDTLSGVSKKRFYKMMKEGQLSFTTEEWGKGTRRIIEGAELARVFGDKFVPAEKKETKEETTSGSFLKPSDTTETSSETIGLRTEVQVLRKEVTMQGQLIQTLQEEKDDWKKQAQTLLLQAPAKDADFKPVQSNDDSSSTGDHEIKAGHSGAKFGVLAAVLLIGVTSVLFWPEIKRHFLTADYTEMLTQHLGIELFVPRDPVDGNDGKWLWSKQDLNFTPIPSEINEEQHRDNGLEHQ